MSFDSDRQITNWITDKPKSQRSLLASHWVVPPSMCRFLPRANDSHLFLWLLKNKTSSLPLTTLMGWNWTKFLSQTVDDPVFLLYQENTPPSFSSFLETTISRKHHRALGHRWVLESTMSLSIKAASHHTGWSPTQPFTGQPLRMQKSATYTEVSVHSHWINVWARTVLKPAANNPRAS